MAVDFFNDQSDPQALVNPTPTEVHKKVVKALGQTMRVCMPGIVIGYDYKKQMATVQPSFSNQYNDGTVSPLPLIYNVPVVHPRTGSTYTHVPIAKNDRVLLMF